MIRKCFSTTLTNEDQRRILLQGCRYGLTTPLSIACECFGTSDIGERTTEALDALLANSLLEEFQLTETNRCYIVTDAGRELVRTKDQSFDCRQSFRTLVTSLAMLHFCCVLNERCLLVNQTEIDSLLPGLRRMGSSKTQYVKSQNVKSQKSTMLKPHGRL